MASNVKSSSAFQQKRYLILSNDLNQEGKECNARFLYTKLQQYLSENYDLVVGILFLNLKILPQM